MYQAVEQLHTSLNQSMIDINTYNSKIEDIQERYIKEALEGLSEDLTALECVCIHKELSEHIERLVANYKSTDINQDTADKKYKSYFNSLKNEKKNKITTGFKSFDEKINGISSGLTLVTGLSSLGKSTFCIQLADSIAMKGNKVIYLNAEMQNHHTWSKSITRLSNHHSQLYYNDIVNIEDCPQHKIDSFMKTVDLYNQFATNIVIKQASKNWVAELYSDIEALKDINDNKPPVVFIDYLQILQPLPDSQSRGNEYTHINEVLNALKKIIQDTGAFIVAISSLNRASYEKGISLQSMKGSGNLEYSAEMVLALQPSKEDTFEGFPIYDNSKNTFDMELVNSWKRKENKLVSLAVLKNRMGCTGLSFDLMFESSKAKFTEYNRS